MKSSCLSTKKLATRDWRIGTLADEFLTEKMAVRKGIAMKLATELDEWEVRKGATSLGGICNSKKSYHA